MGCSGSAFTIGVIDGSLRKDSNNKGLTKYLESLKPEDCKIIFLKIDDLPLMNQDLEQKIDGFKKVKFPSNVQRLRDEVRGVDAIIFSTPEYNGGVSGPLKNAYDWLSRDFTSFGGSQVSPMKAKKLGIVGASYVSENSIKDVKKMIEYMKVPVFQQTFYTRLGANFDQKGNLINETEKQRLKEWAIKFWNYALPQQPKSVEVK